MGFDNVHDEVKESLCDYRKTIWKCRQCFRTKLNSRWTKHVISLVFPLKAIGFLNVSVEDGSRYIYSSVINLKGVCV